MNEKALVPVEAGIVRPAVTPEEALEAWGEYQDLKSKIVEPSDIQRIGKEDFLKKSYWRKVATFFNLQVECVKEEHFKEDGVLYFTVIHRARHPNGRFADGDGACDSSEKGMHKSFHNTRAIAMTRSWNRAVSNLVGGGEVSAEEINAPMGEATKPSAPSGGGPPPKTAEDAPPDRPECPECGQPALMDSKFGEGQYCNPAWGGCKAQIVPIKEADPDPSEPPFLPHEDDIPIDSTPDPPKKKKPSKTLENALKTVSDSLDVSDLGDIYTKYNKKLKGDEQELFKAACMARAEELKSGEEG